MYGYPTFYFFQIKGGVGYLDYLGGLNPQGEHQPPIIRSLDSRSLHLSLVVDNDSRVVLDRLTEWRERFGDHMSHVRKNPGPIGSLYWLIIIPTWLGGIISHITELTKAFCWLLTCLEGDHHGSWKTRWQTPSLGLSLQQQHQLFQYTWKESGTSPQKLLEVCIHMSYGQNYLFGENAITKCGGSPIGFEYYYSVHPLIWRATHMVYII